MKTQFFILAGLILFACNTPGEKTPLTMDAKDTRLALRRSGQLLDIRAAAAFDRAHIAGAGNFDVSHFQTAPGAQTRAESAAEFYSSLPGERDAYLVVYAENRADETQAKSFVLALRKRGFKKAFVVNGGYEALAQLENSLTMMDLPVRIGGN